MARHQDTNSTDKIIVRIDADLQELIPGFLENRRRDLTKLETALEHHDTETIRLLGHRMRGDGGGYGFHEISAIGDALEKAGINDDWMTITEQIGQLYNYLDCLEIVYC